MASFNAFGEYPPPIIIIAGERIRDVGLADFPEAVYSTTANGWMDSGAVLEYMKTVYEFVTTKHNHVSMLPRKHDHIVLFAIRRYPLNAGCKYRTVLSVKILMESCSKKLVGGQHWCCAFKARFPGGFQNCVDKSRDPNHSHECILVCRDVFV